MRVGIWPILFTAILLTAAHPLAADELAPLAVEGQPLAANIERLCQALDYLGAPISQPARTQLQTASAERDSVKLQSLLDPQVLFVVSINPESRVQVARGP